MKEMFVPVLLAIIVGVVEYFSKRINLSGKKYSSKILSFSAGVSITYLLLELLPNFMEAALGFNKYLILALPLGFISHHLIEKEIYKHNYKHDLVKMLTLEEHLFYFFYHILLGTVIVTFSLESTTKVLLLFFTILSFTAVSNLPSLKHRSVQRALFLSTSTLIGVLLALSIWRFVPQWVHFSLVGFAAGILLFTIIRHHIPFGRKGRIGYFSVGFILYSIIIMASWSF
ncbi:hypothetical protein HOD05_00780 [Candidatus Woesearchaeota archaeon]|jgi:hypothetical protein|nr:hypothetical protein [Candidatus Woesearchaeota archaeon]MBT4150941.1 hypothetical protein [Candidatus Woesearchaeota archaeon]MBT4247084.1 hypothetical protein [Candidatus Woesearchaeota archaeon]MBT4433731.1 hypothetical protein [Candidatus Woesearchaeota archaeon]MBT7332260.1 hypothetical protein [Candidatus Woesearchaeota archaeon]